MKMSDVFKDYELEYWGAFSAALEADIKYGSKFQAAMYATANHDALVELNKELVRKIKNISEGQIKVMISEQPVSFDWVDADDYFSELLEKAKELNQ